MTGAETVQTCYLVPDLEAACAQFHEAYGIGPFIGGGEAVLDEHVYRGKAAEPMRLKGVFVQSGTLNIELVEILSSGPCVFTEDASLAMPRIHHTAIFCDDYKAEKQRLAAAGYPVVSEFTVQFGASICYVDTRALNGHYLELYPENAVIRDMYAQAKDASETWDGSGPLIRPFQF